MPQMSPLSWLNLFMFFFMVFFMFNIMIFFSFNYKPIKSSNQNIVTKKLNWKW
uniref:ATP synthase complex subunit 8 n=1 Tax=Curculionoidea sp. 23 KM-2017 TaxID=2219407 RepID=A0A346RHK6_9CUCU|nr:ATP synthase F0 subunit 8 [Curculionoidea sp. 23 KM-2017]